MASRALLLKAAATVSVLLSMAQEKQIQTQRFPRDMRRFAIDVAEIPVVFRPNLSISDVRRCLCVLSGQQFTEEQKTISDRDLFGLLHIGPPSNIILLREGLPTHIVNFVIAHELGHFLADVYLVQRLWLKALPEQRAEVARAFSWQAYDAKLELQALVKGLPERPHEIMQRGDHEDDATAEREILADLIARELIAPWEHVIKRFPNLSRMEFTNEVYRTFELPRRIAYGYYDDVQHFLAPRQDFIGRLFSPLLRKNPKI